MPTQMPSLQRPVVCAVVAQHIEDAAALRNQRSVLLRAPHVELHRLARLDERLEAHLDGALVAGDDGYLLAQAALEQPGVGQLFVTAVLAIERRDLRQIERLLALVGVLPEATKALASAFGWVSPETLRGLTAPLLQSDDPLRRWLGVAACAAHRVDPGPALPSAITHSHPLLRAKALRAAAQLGRVDMLALIARQPVDDDPDCRLAAAWAAVLLGDRSDGLRSLHALALAKEGPSLEALQLSLLAAEPDAARALVRRLVDAGAPLRITIRAAAWAGDLQAMPWLIKHLSEDARSQLAGESFSFLTGANLALLDLERKGASPQAGGPNDDPADDNVALDEDESLPWPEPALVANWWQRHGDAMPRGQRCFGGAVADESQCRLILKDAGQRQRYAAALQLSLMRPGEPLFNVAGPARRQQRLLRTSQL